ncbi:hypothetical protein CHELA1G11_11422 [Hyphomicrobiales bacterium]|nr:hypothetical protein CHELA1G11_11422 [Hyphomicrobiales bacterium]CAH1667877.1 hypothetical protein CHELA1G2_12887 [Hyphomicrobiales bacterium]
MPTSPAPSQTPYRGLVSLAKSKTLTLTINVTNTWASSRECLLKAVAKGSDLAQIPAIRRRWAASWTRLGKH